MKIDDSRRSDNVEDGRSGGGGIRGTHIGIGTIAVVVIGYFLGVNPMTLLGLMSATQQSAPVAEAPAVTGDSKDPQVDFVRAVLGETVGGFTDGGIGAGGGGTMFCWPIGCTAIGCGGATIGR